MSLDDAESELEMSAIQGHYESVGDSPRLKRERLSRFVGGVAFTTLIVIVAAILIMHAGPSSISPRVEDPNPSSLHQTHHQGLSSAAEATCDLDNSVHIVDVDSVRRNFELYVPQGASRESPLIIAWHGLAGDPASLEAKIRLKERADKLMWVVAYPIGTGVPKSFNGAGCCSDHTLGPVYDDVGFAKAIITYLTDVNSCADGRNVFSMGFSNGAFMTNRLACQAGLKQDGEPWIRAIATHSGLIGKDEETSSCQPHTVVPVIAFQADDDPTVGIEGYGPKGIIWNSYLDTMKIWATLNGCGKEDTPEPWALGLLSNTTKCQTYSGCAVSFCIVSGGLGHNWSGEPDLNRTHDIDATKVMISFFKKHMV